MNRRFELPTWFLMLLMMAALGVAIWAVARDEIYELIEPWLP